MWGRTFEGRVTRYLALEAQVLGRVAERLERITARD
jgi:hypothetical protein